MTSDDSLFKPWARLSNSNCGPRMQGYHAAWTDADIALTQNIFLIFSRWFDLVAGWSGGNVTAEPLAQIDKVVGYELKAKASDHALTPSHTQNCMLHLPL